MHTPPARRARILDRIFEAQLWIACAALLLMMLVVVTDVVLRYVLASPLRGAYDLVQITLVVMVFLGLPRLFVDGSHIAIDLIDHLLPPAGIRFLVRVAAILSVLALGFVSYAMIGPLRSAYQYGDRSLELDLPQWIVWLVALVGVGGAIVAALASAFDPGPPASGAVDAGGRE